MIGAIDIKRKFLYCFCYNAKHFWLQGSIASIGPYLLNPSVNEDQKSSHYFWISLYYILLFFVVTIIMYIACLMDFALYTVLQDGLVTVGFVECFREKELCATLGMQSGIKFFNLDQIQSGHGTEISSLTAQEIAREVLKLMPDMKLLDEDIYKVSLRWNYNCTQNVYFLFDLLLHSTGVLVNKIHCKYILIR